VGAGGCGRPPTEGVLPAGEYRAGDGGGARCRGPVGGGVRAARPWRRVDGRGGGRRGSGGDGRGRGCSPAGGVVLGGEAEGGHAAVEVEQLEEAVTGSDPTADITVEHREAAPVKRPDGLAYDPDEGVLAYDFWSAQQTCLDDLASGDYDIVALLGGTRGDIIR